MDKENTCTCRPPAKKQKLSLSLKKNRFKTVSKDTLKEMAKPFVPKNTKQSSKWAMTNLEEWFHNYNSRNPDDTCPEEFLLPSCPPDILCKWLCIFVTETRSKRGKEYHPKTIMSLLAGILRCMRANNPHYPNFLSKENPSFTSFHVTHMTKIELHVYFLLLQSNFPFISHQVFHFLI